MNKKRFLSELRRGLSGLPQAEVEERLSFYSDMIDDRIEDGCSEAAAVAEIGSYRPFDGTVAVPDVGIHAIVSAINPIGLAPRSKDDWRTVGLVIREIVQDRPEPVCMDGASLNACLVNKKSRLGGKKRCGCHQANRK